MLRQNRKLPKIQGRRPDLLVPGPALFMTTITYAFTPDVFTKPLILSISSDGLLATQDSKPVLFGWSDIMQVHLWFDPTRFDRRRYRCQVSTRSGKTITINSTSCEGVGNFRSQAHEYRQLIAALHEELRAKGKNVVFRGGVGGMRYAVNVFCMIAGLALISFALLLAGLTYVGPTVLVQLIVVASGIWLTLKWIRKNRPAKYDPILVPPALLPEA